MASTQRFEAHLEVLEAARLTKATAAIRVTVYDDEEKLGELEIGQGSLMWRGSHKKDYRRMPWDRFAEVMEEFGRKSRSG